MFFLVHTNSQLAEAHIPDARQAGLKEVPVFVKELTEKQTMQLALIDAYGRDELESLISDIKSLWETYRDKKESFRRQTPQKATEKENWDSSDMRSPR